MLIGLIEHGNLFNSKQIINSPNSIIVGYSILYGNDSFGDTMQRIIHYL